MQKVLKGRPGRIKFQCCLKIDKMLKCEKVSDSEKVASKLMRLQKPQCGRKHYAGIRKDLWKALLGRRKVG